MKHQGSCSCDSVRIGLLTDPIMKYYCHCSHCRRFASAHCAQQAKPYQSACAAWRWTVVLQGEDHIDYEHTVGAWGLFSLSRGRCSKCKDPIWERGGRAALPFCMVVAEPLQIQPDMNLYYDSGFQKGPNNDKVRVTIHSDMGSFLYELWLVVTVAIPAIPRSLLAWMTSSQESLSSKAD